tara:strand:+ start:761 stop:958 length:198 start_codon:yes stop_codon:yes gene_type:complete
MSNEADGVIEEINEEIKKAQGEPEGFKSKSLTTLKRKLMILSRKKVKKKILILSMERKFKSAYRS